MVAKKSLRTLDDAPFAQEHITCQAFLFAQLTLEEAKRNSLTREEIIKDNQSKKA